MLARLLLIGVFGTGRIAGIAGLEVHQQQIMHLAASRGCGALRRAAKVRTALWVLSVVPPTHGDKIDFNYYLLYQMVLNGLLHNF